MARYRMAMEARAAIRQENRSSCVRNSMPEAEGRGGILGTPHDFTLVDANQPAWAGPMLLDSVRAASRSAREREASAIPV